MGNYDLTGCAVSSGGLEGWPARLMIVLVKGHPVLCGWAFIELSGAVGEAALVSLPARLPACPPPPSMGSITPPPPPSSGRNPTTRAPPITADEPHLSIRVGNRAVRLPFRARDGKKEMEGRSGNRAVEKRERKEECGDKRGQLAEPSMSNFAKTDAELRPACALLILTTYTRIKKHLLTDWHAWINHRAILKGTINSLSWQTWQISLKGQMSSEWKRATRSVIISGIVRRTFKDSAKDRLCLSFFFFFNSWKLFLWGSKSIPHEK